MKQTKQLKKHENDYIHIKKPNLKVIGNFLLGIMFSILTFFSFKLLIYKWKQLGLNILLDCTENCSELSNILKLDICFNLIVTAILIFLSIMFLFNLCNEIDYKGLIYGLIIGLSMGLIVGLILGLIYGLIYGLIMGLIYGLIFGLIGGLIGVLIGEKNDI